MTEPFGRLRRFLRELKRRNVYKVAVAYAAAAFVVVQAARLLVPALLLPDWIYRAVVLAALLGFPLALVVAWAFEMTAEGVRRTPEAEPTEKVAAEAAPGLSTGYKVLVGLGLVAAAVAGGWYLTGGGSESAISDRSVAVLPFETLGDTSSTTFTEGLHNDLITRLQRVSELTVIARPSVMRYEDTDQPLSQVASELGARWLVTAAVQSSGAQVQVNPRLVNPRTGTERWSASYRRQLSADQVFAVQGQITREIADALEAQLASSERERVERQPTGDLGAYQLYVQGRRELVRRSQGDVERAVRLFRRAIERDSSFALAWAGLADAAGHDWWAGYGGYDTLDVTPGEAARRAVELAPDLAEAHASMGLVHYRQRNGPAALRKLQRAVELKSSYAEAHNGLGLVYLVLGHPDRALQHLEIARDLNPQHLFARHYLYDTYIMMGQPERALAEIREQQRRYPESEGPYVAETRALYALDRFVEAEAVLRERLLGKHPMYSAYLAAVETAQGDTARARQRVASLQQQKVSPIVLAVAHAALGRTDEVIDAYQAVEDWDYVATFLLRYIRFPAGIDRIRDRPEYAQLLRAANRYWGLNPDGSLPDSVDVSFGSESDE